MHPFLPALVLLSASITSTAFAAELPAWEPVSTELTPLSFVSGPIDNSYPLSLKLPELPDWDSLTAFISLSTDVFQPLTAASFSTGYPLAFDIGVVDDGPAPGGLHKFQMFMTLAAPTAIGADDLAFTMTLVVKPNLAPSLLGPQQILTDIEYTTFFDEFSGSSTIYANVSAVPEPQTWATLAAGLALIGTAVRRRRKTSLDAIWA